MTLRWSFTAGDDLETIYKYIARDNPEAAIRTVWSIGDAAGQLLRSPGIGRLTGQLGQRELVHPPYLIVYHQIDDVINVDAVHHGRRRH